ncbi:MAG: hypothetical protein M1827_006031 [Pycnora praestabilis]|nr:MAG: hypothetical protein M1827_006031 [Pycnora praestabilis]
MAHGSPILTAVGGKQPSLPEEDNLTVPKLTSMPGPSSDVAGFEPKPVESGSAVGHSFVEAGDGAETDPPSPISKFLKGKEKEWNAVAEKKGPLQLLDLPVDVLKEIIKEVTHTNDLTALALTHSALHNLTVPHIYSRFDIVWPDAHATADPRTGVDALTYGLATLVMGEEIFGESSSQNTTKSSIPSQNYACGECGTVNHPYDNELNPSASLPSRPRRRRRGNHFSQYTRKFSLGNGPPDWVAEYMITKEGGKMLGTLVALALARMPNLETFTWDMPTGVLRDVWLALSSLGDGRNGHECRLERIWVRWHDNSESLMTPNSIPPPPPPPPPLGTITPVTSVGVLIPPNAGSTIANMSSLPNLQFVPPLSLDRVEYPTFSVVPSLKSLSVLDIDELPYLEEMSILIGRSQDRIRELRVGIAAHAEKRPWVGSWDGEGIQQVDHNAYSWTTSTLGPLRLGGVLGVLVGRVYDIRRKPRLTHSGTRKENEPPSISTSGAAHSNNGNGFNPADTSEDLAHPGSITSATANDALIPAHGSNDPAVYPLSPTFEAGADQAQTHQLATNSGDPPVSHTIPDLHIHMGLNNHPPDASALPGTASNQLEAVDHTKIKAQPVMSGVLPVPTLMSIPQIKDVSEKEAPTRQPLNGKLKLDILELERVPLSIPVMHKAFDWSVLTSLTLLQCENHEELWKALRRAFSPRPIHSPISVSSRANSLPVAPHGLRHYKSSSLKNASNGQLEYQLNLKKVHVDAVSPSLISFLRDTLAPNSLETLFLQEGQLYTSNGVTIENIYRGPLRRHRTSLKKLMIDSSSKTPGQVGLGPRWKKWIFNREVLTFVTSGRMSSLRELGMSLEYKDWHYFLQRLPLVPHLRSLYIPFIVDHVHASNLDPRELALQVVDIVALRPEVEICYMGILSKCFEILEKKCHEERHGSHETGASLQTSHPGGTDPEDENDGSEEDDEDENGVDEEDIDDAVAIAAGVDPDETDSDLSSSEPIEESDDEDLYRMEEEKSRVTPRLREILFYDDKVAIFKARHGRL